MNKLEPFTLDELDEVVGVAHGLTPLAWTVKLKEYTSPLLVWATTMKQAAAIAANRKCDCCDQPVTITSIQRNHHAQNMTPKPTDWTSYLCQGGAE